MKPVIYIYITKFKKKKIITLIFTSVFRSINILVKILKDRNWYDYDGYTDCIRGLLINYSHLKELFILSNIIKLPNIFKNWKDIFKYD